MPIVDRYNDRGTIVMGKVESGCCKKGDNIVVMPNKVSFLLYVRLLSCGDEDTSPDTIECLKGLLQEVEMRMWDLHQYLFP